MSQAFGSPQKRRKPTINITSLIDVMFLLLIFFMISSTFKKEEQAIDITLPQSGTSIAQPLDYKEVMVDGHGVLFINGNQVQNTELKKQLATILAKEPESRIVLRADADADWQAVVNVIDIVKAVGVHNLIIPTDRLEGAPASQ